jgi:hypothetical protein
MLGPMLTTLSLLTILATSPPAPVAVSLEQPVTLSLGGAATHEKFIVVFSRVVRDSRCPEGVQCKWAGEIVVRLAVARAARKPTEHDLSFQSANRPPTLEHDGYRITVLAADTAAVTLKLERLAPAK